MGRTMSKSKNIPNGTTITARYTGICKFCQKEYTPGTQITRSGYKMWVHYRCFKTNGQGEENGQESRSLEEESGNGMIQLPELPPETNGHAQPQAESTGEYVTRPELNNHIAALSRAVANTIDSKELSIVNQASAISTAAANALQANMIQALETLKNDPALKVDPDTLAQLVKTEIAKASFVPRFEVRNAQASLFVEGKPHPKFDRAFRLACRRKNIMLIGPAGSGKSYLAEQIAKALNLRYGFISCAAGMSEGALLGRLLPIGKGGQFQYVISEFVRCYEEGGAFLLDEFDAADPNTVLVLNAALANGHMAIPNRPDNPIAKRHPDFICIAAMNTFGTGADRQYVGRNQLDEATLDRFRIGQIEMDYDADLEASVCPDDTLRTRLQSIRQKCRDNKIRRIVSMRFAADAYDMLTHGGDTMEDVEDALFKGWTRDELAKVGKR